MIQNTKVQVASLVLIFTLSFVFFANKQYFSAGAKNGELTQGSRFPASIDPQATKENAHNLTRNELSQIEENELAEEVAKVNPRRALASLGEPADGLQTLEYEKLEGKYIFKMDGNLISHISVSDESQAIVITDRADFLKQFSSQFGVTDKPKRVSAVTKGATMVETYRMKSVAGNSDRLIRVVVGQSNGLLEITSEMAPENHIF